MSKRSFAIFPDEQATSLSPVEIERALSSLWKPMLAGEAGEGVAVTRVVLGNVLWIGLAEQAEEARRAIHRVVPKFPCRAFMLEYRPDDDSETVSAGANVQCFVPRKGAAPVCCEAIHMAFGPRSIRHLRGCVAPLLLPDVQTVLWESLCGTWLREFDELQQYVDRTITRASLTPWPHRVLHHIVDSGRPIYDLAWFRSAPLRDHVTAAFDEGGPHGFDLRRVVSVDAAVANEAGPPRLGELLAALMVGWFGSHLDWTPGKQEERGVYLYSRPGGSVTTRIRRAAQTQHAGDNCLASLTLEDDTGHRLRIGLGKEGGALEVHSGSENGAAGIVRRVVAPELAEADALGLALNRPMSRSQFRPAARLAIPLLQTLS